jgi:uncharacterized cupin superfamily protein
VPKIDIANVPEITGSKYPAQFRHIVEGGGGRIRKALGDAAGLTQFGVRLTRLPVGAASALRHWHACEDEFVYVLEGVATLITNNGEETLSAGEAAGFPAGEQNGHCLLNKGDAEVVYLEIGTRAQHDFVDYPDVDLRVLRGTKPNFYMNKAGVPYRE